jgi:hypothetical protein
LGGLCFATFCFSPWAWKIKAEFARSVFPAGSALNLELDLSGFLCGDVQTRRQIFNIAVERGILDREKIRKIEGGGRKPASAVG